VTIIVVGAGIVGCSIACELASRGASVRVVDPRRAGEGATRASAGTLAPFIEGHLPSLRALGASSLALYNEFIGRLSRDSGAEIEYARSGTMQIARSSGEAAALAAAARELDACTVRHDLLDARGARDLEPGLAGVSAALVIPDHGFVAVQALTAALQRCAVRAGAAWMAERMTAVTPTASGVEVATTGGNLAADAVVIATGAWSGDPVTPIRGQLVHLRLEAPLVHRVIWGTDCYLVPWRDGSLLVGATVEDVGFDESPTPEGVRSLMQAAAGLVPAVRGARIQEVRVGLRPATPDGLPAIGRSSTMRNVFYATGHYRTGVLLAPLTASLVADLIVDGRERPELALVRPDRLGL
jgi:glycine oxidase